MKAWVRALFLILIAGEILASQGFFGEFKLDFSWLGLIATSTMAFIFVELLRLPWQLNLLVLLDVLLDAISDTQNLYSKFADWDTLLHFIGGAVVAVLAIYILDRAINSGHLAFANRMVGITISAVCLVSLFGMLYEAQEYLTDRYYLNYQKQLGDGPDTVIDQLANILGAVVVSEAYILMATMRRKPAVLDLESVPKPKRVARKKTQRIVDLSHSS